MKEFPRDVWLVSYSNYNLIGVSKHWSPIEKLIAIKETEKSLTTKPLPEQCYRIKNEQCRHKRVMKDNAQAFFYSEAEAKAFFLEKLNAKEKELNNQLQCIAKNRELWCG